MAQPAAAFPVSFIPGPECAPCLDGLARAVLAGCGLLPGAAKTGPLAARLDEVVADGLARGHSPALIASRFLALARQESGVDDPFAAKKCQDMAAARRAAAGLGPLPASLAAVARAAILGNALDHFTGPGQDGPWRGGLGRLSLGVDDLAQAEALLRPGALVAILADNCGEQAFDRPLVGHLLGRGCQVVYVVKSAPAQNDLTLDDLRRAGEDYGLGRIVGTGSAQVGLDPRDVSAEIGALLARADLVIAKGMGHYETLRPAAGLWPHGGPPRPLLLLFLAKCAPVARSLDLAPGQGVALLIPPAEA